MALDANRDYYDLKSYAGGYFPFDGVFDNNKQIQSISVDRDNSTATVNYTDGYYFTVSATITKSGNNYTISNIQKTWGHSNGNN